MGMEFESKNVSTKQQIAELKTKTEQQEQVINDLLLLFLQQQEGGSK